MENIKDISIEEYNYNLPDARIAKYPKEERDSSNLLLYRGGDISQDTFVNIKEHLPENSILVFNNTKVIRARLMFKKSTGATIEIFCLEPHKPSDYVLSLQATESCEWKCMVGNLKKWKQGELEHKIQIGDDEVVLKAEKIDRDNTSVIVRFSWCNNKYHFSDLLENSGIIPIPPYLNRESESKDLNTYQTVYAKHKGSVAAPTAGLHFTERVFDGFSEKNISRQELTLHVGAGTFKPVSTDTIGEHEMHTEHFSVSRELISKLIEFPESIIAVGTTSIRTLESLYYLGVLISKHGDLNNMHVPQWIAYDKEFNNLTTTEALENLLKHMDLNNLEVLNAATQIIIAPGYKYRVIKGIVTNFHQPKSTLLLLISAFVGENWKKIYDYALNNDFRFLSYGDSSLLMR